MKQCAEGKFSNLQDMFIIMKACLGLFLGLNLKNKMAATDVFRRSGLLKVSISHLLLVLEVWHVKPTYRKSWDGNLLMCSDLMSGTFLKVKRG